MPVTRNSNEHCTSRRSETGVALITVLVALVALLGFAALAIDGGMLWTARTQLQNASDAAALAGAQNLIDVDTPAVTLASAETAAVGQASQNRAVSAPAVSLLPADISYGNWDLGTRTLDTSVDLTDPEQVTAVDVVARLDDSSTGRVPAQLARVLGRDAFTVTARSTAYLGYAGGILPGKVDHDELIAIGWML